MAAQPKPESTAVARQHRDEAREDRALAGLDAHGRREVLEQRMRRQITPAIANESWGQSLSPNAQRAVAAYMQRFNLDVGEVEILGGRIYRNGQYYKRKLAEMRTRGLIEWSEFSMIGPDARLEQLAHDGDEWARGEALRRIRERIRWSVPEDATHACVARVKLRSDERVLEGCDWITPKRTMKTKFGEKLADPVGAAEPEKTVITRAWRRVGILAAAEIPELQAQETVLDSSAVEIAAEVEEIAQDEEARELAASRPKAMMPTVDPEDPYHVDADAPALTGREASRVVIATHAQKVRIAELLDSADIADDYREALAREAGRSTLIADRADAIIAELVRALPVGVGDATESAAEPAPIDGELPLGDVEPTGTGGPVKMPKPGRVQDAIAPNASRGAK